MIRCSVLALFVACWTGPVIEETPTLVIRVQRPPPCYAAYLDSLELPGIDTKYDGPFRCDNTYGNASYWWCVQWNQNYKIVARDMILREVSRCLGWERYGQQD